MIQNALILLVKIRRDSRKKLIYLAIFDLNPKKHIPVGDFLEINFSKFNFLKSNP